MQTGSHIRFLDDLYTAFVHLLGQGKAFKRNVQCVRENLLIVPDVLRIISAVKPEIQAFTISVTDTA